MLGCPEVLSVSWFSLCVTLFLRGTEMTSRPRMLVPFATSPCPTWKLPFRHAQWLVSQVMVVSISHHHVKTSGTFITGAVSLP